MLLIANTPFYVPANKMSGAVEQLAEGFAFHLQHELVLFFPQVFRPVSRNSQPTRQQAHSRKQDHLPDRPQTPMTRVTGRSYDPPRHMPIQDRRIDPKSGSRFKNMMGAYWRARLPGKLLGRPGPLLRSGIFLARRQRVVVSWPMERDRYGLVFAWACMIYAYQGRGWREDWGLGA